MEAVNPYGNPKGLNMLTPAFTLILMRPCRGYTHTALDLAELSRRSALRGSARRANKSTGVPPWKEAVGRGGVGVAGMTPVGRGAVLTCRTIGERFVRDRGSDSSCRRSRTARCFYLRCCAYRRSGSGATRPGAAETAARNPRRAGRGPLINMSPPPGRRHCKTKAGPFRWLQ